MITEETITTEIEKLEKEQATLKESHDQLIREDQIRQKAFQDHVVRNQNRFQQITGAIAHLKQLLNGKDKP